MNLNYFVHLNAKDKAFSLSRNTKSAITTQPRLFRCEYRHPNQIFVHSLCLSNANHSDVTTSRDERVAIKILAAEDARLQRGHVQRPKPDKAVGFSGGHLGKQGFGCCYCVVNYAVTTRPITTI